MEAKVVVGVDGSAGSRLAVDWALEEARVRAVPCVLVHAWDLEPPMYPADRSFEAQSFEVAQAKARTILKTELARAGGQGVEVLGATEIGGAAEILVEASRDASLLVVGSHGRGYLATLLLGSVAATCIRHARCPVAVIPPAWQSSSARATDTRTTKAIRARLDEERGRLERHLKILVADLPHAESDVEAFGELAAIDQHEADIASEVFEHERAAGMAIDVRHQIDEVDQAHRRIDEGTYGICEACGELMDPDRLEQVPAARLCITHERQWERAGAEPGLVGAMSWPAVDLDLLPSDEAEARPESPEESAVHRVADSGGAADEDVEGIVTY